MANEHEHDGDGVCNHPECERLRALACAIRDHCEPRGIGPMEAAQMLERLIPFLVMSSVEGAIKEFEAQAEAHASGDGTSYGVLENPGRQDDPLAKVLAEIEQASSKQETDDEERMRRAMRQKPGNA